MFIFLATASGGEAVRGCEKKQEPFFLSLGWSAEGAAALVARAIKRGAAVNKRSRGAPDAGHTRAGGPRHMVLIAANGGKRTERGTEGRRVGSPWAHLQAFRSTAKTVHVRSAPPVSRIFQARDV